MYANIKKYFLREKFQTVPESRFVGMNLERLDLTFLFLMMQFGLVSVCMML